MSERENEESTRVRGIRKQYFLIIFNYNELLEMVAHCS